MAFVYFQVTCQKQIYGLVIRACQKKKKKGLKIAQMKIDGWVGQMLKKNKLKKKKLLVF